MASNVWWKPDGEHTFAGTETDKNVHELTGESKKLSDNKGPVILCNQSVAIVFPVLSPVTHHQCSCCRSIVGENRFTSIFCSLQCCLP